MDVVGLIPARAGSQGIPRKNVVELAGKPLLAWSVQAALASERLTRTVVSTESDEIAAIAAAAGAEVLRRPPALAADDTPMLPVVRHAVELLHPDVVVLLQPTSPLRRAEHIDAALAALLASDADGVVSVVPVPHRYAPGSLLRLEGDRVRPLDPVAPVARQAKPVLYARNGPAVLALRAERLAESLYAGELIAFEMAPRDSIDVDTPFDLELAELLLAEDRA